MATPTKAIPADDEVLLDASGAAAALGMSIRGLENWRSRGIGPAYVRFGHNSIRYRAKALRDWVLSREREPSRFAS